MSSFPVYSQEGERKPRASGFCLDLTSFVIDSRAAENVFGRCRAADDEVIGRARKQVAHE